MTVHVRAIDEYTAGVHPTCHLLHETAPAPPTCAGRAGEKYPCSCFVCSDGGLSGTKMVSRATWYAHKRPENRRRLAVGGFQLANSRTTGRIWHCTRSRFNTI